MTCGFNDFDFLIGQWKVHHRQLRSRPARCTAWQEFVGHSEARKILGGFGTLDESILFAPRGTYRVASLSTFDTVSDRWHIWWYDGRTPGHIHPPLVGKFVRGIGIFYGSGWIDDVSTDLRYLWDLRDDSPRWERAHVTANGNQWETDWIMEFHRAS